MQLDIYLNYRGNCGEAFTFYQQHLGGKLVAVMRHGEQLSLETDADAERVYTLLAEGGDIFMPMSTTFFASRFGMLRDRFGTSWMLVKRTPMQA